MDSYLSRTMALVGREAVEKLGTKSIIVFGLGGVGSFCAEALARCGVGSLTLVDSDTVSVSNINRQLYALGSTVGCDKTAVAEKRIRDINPDCNVSVFNTFYLPENADEIDLSKYDYVADAVDTVAAKTELAVRCEKLGVPIISCMGTGNKTDPTCLKVSDIYDTEGCPLCRAMRSRLRHSGVSRLKTVWSTEPTITPTEPVDGNPSTPASMIFVPASAGLLMAKEIIFDLIGE